MTIVVDIDGVICEETKPYATAKLIVGAREKINYWVLYCKHRVILHTARRERDRKLTVKWLKDNGILYHKLVMGKPKGDLYIDDRAIHFNGDWDYLP